MFEPDGRTSMRRTTTIVVAIAAALVVAAVALASDGTEKANAARACRAERTAMGEQAFKLLYGTNLPSRSNAFGKCVSKHVRAQHQAAANASQACRAERESLGDAPFAAKYGRSETDRSAFGRCVSQHAKETLTAQQEATVNAARTCKAERKTLGLEEFGKKYGTNPNRSNAFGKCVSKLVRA
jgi:hypothetical protein